MLPADQIRRSGRWLGAGRLLAAAGLAVLGASSGFVPAARAGFDVSYPTVETGVLEIESRAYRTSDHDRTLDNEQGLAGSLSYGVTDFWSVELEGEGKKDPQGDMKYKASNIGNIFQLTPQGKYWLDAGFKVEYSFARLKGQADAVKFGPLLQMEWGPTLNTLNLYLEHEVGAHSSNDTVFSYGFQTRLGWREWLDPAIEVFGEMGDLGDFKPARQQEHRAGPVLLGDLPIPGMGKWKYEAGYLFGLTRATPSGTIKLMLEYEIPL